MGRRLLALQVQSSFQNSLHYQPRGCLAALYLFTSYQLQHQQNVMQARVTPA